MDYFIFIFMDTTKPPLAILSDKQKKYIDDICDLYGFRIPRVRRFNLEFGYFLMDLFGFDKELSIQDNHQRGLGFIKKFRDAYYYEYEKHEFAHKHKISNKDIRFIIETLNLYSAKPLIRENIDDIDSEETAFKTLRQSLYAN